MHFDKNQVMLVFLAFVIAIIFNFNNSLIDFIIGAVLYFVVLTALLLGINYLGKRKKIGTKTGIAIFILGLLGLIIVVSLLGIICLCGCNGSFRTNIFTEQCDYGCSIRGCGEHPWYYSMGCSEEAKKEWIMVQPGFSEFKKTCDLECETNSEFEFCFDKKQVNRIKLNCNSFFECEKFQNCEDYLGIIETGIGNDKPVCGNK